MNLITQILYKLAELDKLYKLDELYKLDKLLLISAISAF